MSVSGGRDPAWSSGRCELSWPLDGCALFGLLRRMWQLHRAGADTRVICWNPLRWQKT